MARIPQRKRIFVGCEGQSERGYAVFLQELANRLGLHVFLDAHVAGGGDHLEVVERSIKALGQRERRGRFAAKFIFVDEDLFGAHPQKTAAMYNAAARAGVSLILQRWDHEAFLLRHLPNCSTLRPARGDGERRLRQHWNDYRKGMAATDLLAKLTLADVQTAAAAHAQLRKLLDEIGLP
jgi:hypothetical protein